MKTLYYQQNIHLLKDVKIYFKNIFRKFFIKWYAVLGPISNFRDFLSFIYFK